MEHSHIGCIRNQSGFALFAILLPTVLLATLGSAGLLFSNMDLLSTGSYKTGGQAFFAAESGALHALSVINGRGVQDFQADIAMADQWSRLFGTGTKTLLGEPNSSYAITVMGGAGDPVNTGRIIATGFGPQQARRVIDIRLRKGINADQGALYLANDIVQPDFGARDQFLIDGNDHKMDLSLNASGPVRPGVSTRNDAVTDLAKSTLSDPQKLKVQGLEFSVNPLNPSVVTTEGPTVTDLDQIINRLLTSNPVVNVGDAVLANGAYGTPTQPQVTHLTNKNVRLDGNMTGAGILIADGEFTINGSANFIGWMIIRGPTILKSSQVGDTLVDGNATIVGSLWTGDLVVQVGGSAIIDFCIECMALANGAGSGNNVPKVMSVTSWQEVF